MAKRSFEERLEEIERQESRALKMVNQYKERRKALEKRQSDEKRKERTHRLIQIGGAAEKVLGRPFEEEDVDRFLRFLYVQEKNGKFYTAAMNRGEPKKQNGTKETG